jgi:hypothetical protein
LNRQEITSARRLIEKSVVSQCVGVAAANTNGHPGVMTPMTDDKWLGPMRGSIPAIHRRERTHSARPGFRSPDSRMDAEHDTHRRSEATDDVSAATE